LLFRLQREVIEQQAINNEMRKVMEQMHQISSKLIKKENIIKDLEENKSQLIQTVEELKNQNEERIANLITDNESKISEIKETAKNNMDAKESELETQKTNLEAEIKKK